MGKTLEDKTKMSMFRLYWTAALFSLCLMTLGCSDEAIDTANVNQMMNPGGQGGAMGAGETCSYNGMVYLLGETRCEAGEEYQCSGLGLWAGIGANPACALTVDRCDEARQTNSYIGCEYWPVDLDNAVEVAGLPLSLIHI